MEISGERGMENIDKVAKCWNFCMLSVTFWCQQHHITIVSWKYNSSMEECSSGSLWWTEIWWGYFWFGFFVAFFLRKVENKGQQETQILLGWGRCNYSTGLKPRVVIQSHLIGTWVKLISYTIIQSTLQKKRRWISLQTLSDISRDQRFARLHLVLATGRQRSISSYIKVSQV